MAMGVGEGTTVRLLREIHFPHSLGLLYSAFTAFLGFEVNEGEYKVMGMAPYGRPIYVDRIWRLVTLLDDGSFWLDTDYFSFHHSITRTFNGRFKEIFGAPREPNASSETIDPYYADIAASIQAVTETVLIRITNLLYRETGLSRLCLAGGVALNSVANWKILQETPFEEIYIQPAAGDSGGAIGAALYVYHTLLGYPRSFVMDRSGWGKEYTAADIRDVLDQSGLFYLEIEDQKTLIDRVVEELVDGKVAGWFQGRFEWGPRALGYRSILADPRRSEMKEVVNRKIKFREPFRPFAPSVVAERADDFFDLQGTDNHYPPRFMLYVVPVREAVRSLIPAVTHVDGSGRLQIVHRETEPLYYTLIERFGEATGVPVLLNTSFNLRGEPIVNAPEDAVSTFLRSEMDCLAIGPFLCKKIGCSKGIRL
jgi:carbamoyltransferase